MVIGVTQNYHSISSILGVFKYLNLLLLELRRYWEINCTVRHSNDFSCRTFRYNPNENLFRTFRHVHRICNIINYGLTPLPLIISQKLGDFHKQSNGHYFLSIIWNSMWLQRRIFKNDRYFKLCNVFTLN